MIANIGFGSRSVMPVMHCFTMIFILFVGLVPLSYAESGPDAQHIFSLINERLEHMEKVALYKHQSHSPVEDLTREKYILDKSLLSATEQGLDSDSISGFFQSQMNAAKAIQYRYRADWLAALPEHSETVNLNNDIRPKLVTLGRDIISGIAGYLRHGGAFSSDQFTQFMGAVKVHNLSIADKENIFRSLLKVRKMSLDSE